MKLTNLLRRTASASLAAALVFSLASTSYSQTSPNTDDLISGTGDGGTDSGTGNGGPGGTGMGTGDGGAGTGGGYDGPPSSPTAYPGYPNPIEGSSANQVWRSSRSLPRQFIKDHWDSSDGDYRVTSMTYNQGVWGVVMTRYSGYDAQVYFERRTTSTRDGIGERIKHYWDKGRDITDLTYGPGGWCAVMSGGTGYTSQAYAFRSYFPKKYIQQKWRDGFQITQLAYGNGQWGVVMSKGTGISTQSYTSNEQWPGTWVNTKWRQGYRISHATYTDGKYRVVMSFRPAEEPDQGVRYRSQPQQLIQEQASNGRALTDLFYQGDAWRMVFTEPLQERGTGDGYSAGTGSGTGDGSVDRSGSLGVFGLD